MDQRQCILDETRRGYLMHSKGRSCKPSLVLKLTHIGRKSIVSRTVFIGITTERSNTIVYLSMFYIAYILWFSMQMYHVFQRECYIDRYLVAHPLIPKEAHRPNASLHPRLSLCPASESFIDALKLLKTFQSVIDAKVLHSKLQLYLGFHLKQQLY